MKRILLAVALLASIALLSIIAHAYEFCYDCETQANLFALSQSDQCLANGFSTAWCSEVWKNAYCGYYDDICKPDCADPGLGGEPIINCQGN